ncbi:hypothetical protein ACIBCN_19340 [Nocardia sp. NPDC051052]|uniref:hypothetical protein n=1 Tax=Nocardia sp. NPDC051052 TaxID=3364322 RepID=UPI003796A258
MTPPTFPPVDAVEVTALAGLYQAERADQQVHMNVSLTLIAGAVAYLGLVVSQFQSLKESRTWPVLIAVPLWMVAAFHVLLMANILTRNKSIQILEARLHAATQLGAMGVAASEIGAERGRKVMDINVQPWALKIQTLVTYVGIIVTLLTFTYYCMWSAYDTQGWTKVVVIGVVVYSLAAVALAAAWIKALVALA